MEFKVKDSTIRLKQGDITVEAVDAIVNAANPSLLGGGGVDGAIHRAGGPAILAECRTLGGCKPGDAKITTGGNLPAKHVIHTVGPIWRGGSKGEPEILASAYRRSLETADQNRLRTVSFPSISTGVYGYPVEKAARTALTEVIEYLKKDTGIKEVNFVLFSRSDYETYSIALKELSG